MKKTLILFAAAAIALVSCAKVQAVYAPESYEIGFSPISQTLTRATTQYAIDGLTFPTTQDMYVAAYQVEPVAENYFAGTNFIYNYAGGAAASSGKWGGATAQYWPLSPAYINFLAYANVTGSAAFNATTPASAAVITQTDNSSTQTDLMYAIGNGAVTQDGNTLTFPTDVPMAFKHAQAWISFTVKAADAASEAITVNSITLNGGKYAGTYTITHTNYNAKTSQSVSGAWTALGEAQNIAVPGWSATALDDTDAATVGHGLMIVPDDLAAGDFTSFTVNYTFGGHTYNYTYTPASTNVEQAKHYIYNLTFTLHEIFVAATVTDWEDQTPIAVAIP